MATSMIKRFTTTKNTVQRTAVPWISDGNCHWVKIGNIVLVRIVDLIVSGSVPSSSASFSNAIFTGLPKLSETGATIILSQYSSYKTFRLGMGNNGDNAYIAPHYDSPAASTGQYYGTFWYITE